MRIKTVSLKHFKRFDDLTIEFGNNPKKIIALVGPNGCGKSSVFDAFEENMKNFKNASSQQPTSFFSKSLYALLPDAKATVYERNNSIQITEINSTPFDKISFYIRSAYRFTSRLNVTTIQVLPDAVEDHRRPSSSIDLDYRLQENYERLLGLEYNEWRYGTKSGQEMREELLGKINQILSKILEIKVSEPVQNLL